MRRKVTLQRKQVKCGHIDSRLSPSHCLNPPRQFIILCCFCLILNGCVNRHLVTELLEFVFDVFEQMLFPILGCLLLNQGVIKARKLHSLAFYLSKIRQLLPLHFLLILDILSLVLLIHNPLLMIKRIIIWVVFSNPQT